MSSVINAIYRNITLDLYTVGSGVTVTAMQADTLSRYIRVTLTNNGSDYEIDEDAHPQIFIVKSDGRIVYNNGTVDDGALLFELDNQMLAAPGKCKTQILLWDRDYEQVLRNATPLFIDVIEKVDEESAVASTSEYGVLEDILQTIEQGGYITDNNFTNAYKDKLDGIETGAEANQNAISQVVADGTTVYSDEKTSSIEFAGSDGISVEADNTSKRITVGVDGEELASALPTASATQAGILTAEDYARFGNGGSGGGVSISQVTETDVTLTTPSAVDYNVPRSESILTQVFDTVYPVGSTFRTETQNGYPQRGSWALTEKELKSVARMYTVNGSVELKVQGVANKNALIIKFLATLPTSISGTHQGTAVALGSMPASAMGVNNFTGLVKEYIEGTISNTDSDIAMPALFSVSSGERSALTLESWEGSLPDSGDNKCLFTLTIPFASISESSTSLPIIYIYKRNG